MFNHILGDVVQAIHFDLAIVNRGLVLCSTSIFIIVSNGIDFVDETRWVAKTKRTIGMRQACHLLCLLAVLGCCGCIDGPMFQLKRLNPVIQNEWKKDRERGPVYSQHVEEMRWVKQRFRSMTSEEQLNWINTINGFVEKESSPELRREAVLALGEVVERPEATGTIINLAKDRNDKVRLEVSKVLKKYPSPETTKTLLALAAADTSQSVRLAATESLGTHRSDEVKQFLSKQLNDRSPAMQYHASLALKDFTGKDFKGDVSLWKRYLAGEEVEPPTASLAESMQSYIPFLR